MSSRATWDETWFEVAHVIKHRSACERKKVGAVIVDTKRRIVATGYNGPAAGFKTQGTCSNYCQRSQNGPEASYNTCPSIHAEANALLYVDRSRLEDGTLYVTTFPCFDCAKLISNSGIIRIVAPITKEDAHRNPEAVLAYLESCGIHVEEC